MSGGTGYLKPRATGLRNPTSNTVDGGRIVNPPRFAELGGLKSVGKAIKKNRMSIRKPGGSAA